MVEMGVPLGGDTGATSLITHGASKVSGIAATEVVTGSPTTAEPLAGSA